MKTITLRQLHEKTGYLVRRAAHYGEIRVTDNGRTVARILPESDEIQSPYFTRRKVLAEFKSLQEAGKLAAGTNVAIAISEDRDKD